MSLRVLKENYYKSKKDFVFSFHSANLENVLQSIIFNILEYFLFKCVFKLNVRIPHSTVDFVATKAARPEFHQLGPNGGIKFGA